MAFPKPPINDVKIDTSFMHYVRDGGFDTSDIGARQVGKPTDIKSERMSIQHVGGTEGGK